MKKIIVCFILSFVFVTGLFADSDIQFKCEPYNSSEIGFSIFPVSFEFHSFFGENPKFGVGGSVDYGILTDYYLTALVGPSVNFPLGERSKFQLISGFMFLYSQDTTNGGTIPSTKISIENKTISYGFAWGTDFQFKFAADKRCSFVVGSTVSFGASFNVKNQIPYSTDKNTTFTPITINGPVEFNIAQFVPYIALSVNF